MRIMHIAVGARWNVPLLLGTLLLGHAPAQAQAPAATAPQAARAVPGVRITMEALHRAGGVPPGWALTPLAGDSAAGRRAFVEHGCHNCHAVSGADFPAVAAEKAGPGPDLTGMGAHHPPAYFVEAILNPDAVLVEGPDYIGPDGRSRMPAYPDMTLAQVADLVAYLASLTTGDEPCHEPAPPAAAPARVAKTLPMAPHNQARVFMLMSYDVKDGRLAELERWFKEEGAAGMMAGGGVVSIDTYVDRTRERMSLITVFGFRDANAYNAFSMDHALRSSALHFDEFIGPHGHDLFTVPPLYRVESLSAPFSTPTANATPTPQTTAVATAPPPSSPAATATPAAH